MKSSRLIQIRSALLPNSILQIKNIGLLAKTSQSLIIFSLSTRQVQSLFCLKKCQCKVKYALIQGRQFQLLHLLCSPLIILVDFNTCLPRLVGKADQAGLCVDELWLFLVIDSPTRMQSALVLTNVILVKEHHNAVQIAICKKFLIDKATFTAPR